MLKLISRYLTIVILFQLKVMAQLPNVYSPTFISSVVYVNSHFIVNEGGLNIINFDTNLVIQSQKYWRGPQGAGSYMYMEKVFTVNENGQDYLIWCGYTDVFGIPPDASGITYVVKTDLLGDTIWTHLYDGGGGTGFCLAPDSNYIFTPTDGYGTILKADRNTGDTLWTKRNKWVIGPYDKLMVNTGFVTNTDSSIYYSGVTYPVSPAAFLLMKADTFGNAQWVKAYGDTTTNISWGAAQCHDGGFIMVGQSAPDDFVVDTLWYHDFLVVRTDSNGDTLWCKRYDHNLQVDKAYSVVETNDHGFAIIGSTHSWIPYPQGNGADIYASTLLLRIDSLGVPIWAKTYDPEMPNTLFYPRQLRKTDSEGFVWGDVLVHVVDSMGINCMAQATTVAVSSPLIQVFSLVTTPEVNMDYCYRPSMQQGIPISGVIDYCNYLGIFEKQEIIEDVLVYPNPSPDFLFVKAIKVIKQIEVFNLMGNKVKTLEGNKKPEVKIELNGFADGVYVLKIKTEDGFAVKRFVVAK